MLGIPEQFWVTATGQQTCGAWAASSGKFSMGPYLGQLPCEILER